VGSTAPALTRDSLSASIRFVLAARSQCRACRFVRQGSMVHCPYKKMPPDRSTREAAYLGSMLNRWMLAWETWTTPTS